MTQNRNGRRGAVFSVRVTDAERAALEALQSADEGPRSLGPWLIWHALTRGGNTDSSARVGITRARVLPDESRDRIRGDRVPRTSERTILDLCGGTGSWSRPYAEAGYHVELVTLPERDVRTYVPPPSVWGVLAAPPCDQFSLARNGHPDLARDLVRGLETVSACLRIVVTARPRWWALENPVGLLSRFLGTPRDVFEPCDFGDEWTKRTALWGDFTIPTRGPFVEPLGGGPFCDECDPDARRTTWCNSAAHRAVTPPGFARAFYEANP